MDAKTRKETLVKSFIEERGEHPGLVAALSALEVSGSFDIFKNRERHKLAVHVNVYIFIFTSSMPSLAYATFGFKVFSLFGFRFTLMAVSR